MHLIVGGNADEVLVKGAMVDRAQTYSVCHYRLAALLDIANDVSSIEQSFFSQRADRAAVVVCREHDSSKPPLM